MTAGIASFATQRGETTSVERSPGEGGFTIVELMVTLVITMVGLGGLLGTHRALETGGQRGLRQAEAVAFGDEALEQLRGLTIDAIETQFGALPIDVALTTVTGRNDLPFERRLAVEAVNLDGDLLRLTVVISWTDDGAVAGADNGAYDHRLVLEVLRTRQESL